MKRIMQKFRNFIIKWLKLDDLNKVNDFLLDKIIFYQNCLEDLEVKLEKNNEITEERINKNSNQNRKLLNSLQYFEDDLDRIESTVRNITYVGMDINEYSSSWGCICVKGKPNRVELFTFPNGNSRQIIELLKSYLVSNTIIDSSFAVGKRLNKEIGRVKLKEILPIDII